MQYIQQMVDSNALTGLFDIPVKMLNKRVTVIIMPCETRQAATPRAKNASAFGSLHRYANPARIPEESGAWEQAVYEKHTAH
jgi:hypothetical protein